jgi:hypothetical protein
MGDAYANRGSRLDSVLADMQAKKQQQMMLEQRRQQHEAELKAQYIASLMQGQPYERRAAIAQQYGIQAPEYVPNEQEMAARDLAAKQRGVVNSWSPDKFQSDTAAMTLVTDKTPNQSTSETMRDQSYMTPEEFTKRLRIGGGLDMSAQQEGTLNETTRHNKVDEGFEGQRTAAQAFRDYAAGGHSKAQTTTELAKLDPNSPVSPAFPKPGSGGAHGMTGPTAPAIAAAGDDVLRGGDITRVPNHARMAVFEYVAAKGGKALPRDVQQKIRDQIGAEVALDQIGGAMERYIGAANNPIKQAKEAINLRASVQGAVPMVARGLGHTGVLTQQDVDSVAASIIGAKGLTGLGIVAAMPDEARGRLSRIRGQFSEVQNRLLQDLLPQGGAGAASGVTTTPDGSQWRKNPDGTMTRVN